MMPYEELALTTFDPITSESRRTLAFTALTIL